MNAQLPTMASQGPLSLWKHHSAPVSAEAMVLLNLSGIAIHVAQENGLKVDDLKRPNRTRRVAWPRHEFMYRAYMTGRYSLNQIGMFLGGMDHTTVLYGCQRYADRTGVPRPVCLPGGPCARGLERLVVETCERASGRSVNQMLQG